MSNINEKNNPVNVHSTSDTKEVRNEASMPNNASPIVSIRDEKPIIKREQDKEQQYKKPNYYKFEMVKENLIKQLDGTRTAQEVRQNLKLSTQTLYKYISLAHTQVAPGQKLMLKEEKFYNNSSSNNWKNKLRQK